MTRAPYYLGCPVWACSSWNGSLFTARAKRQEWLHQYSRVFNTVEGNTVSHGLPTRDTVLRWIESTGEDFRFALKFPQTVSHEQMLVDAERDTKAFLAVLHILKKANRLGPALLQLPPAFSPRRLGDLANYLARLPREFPYAVEVRHHSFCDRGQHESALNQLLAEHHVDRVIMDTRPLFSDSPSDMSERQAQSKKPRLPVHQTVTGSHPMIRLVGLNDVRLASPWIHEWAPIVASWIIAGMTPYVFTHTPDERYAPELARLFHNELGRHTHRLSEMPAWPGEAATQRGRQLALF